MIIIVIVSISLSFMFKTDAINDLTETMKFVCLLWGSSVSGVHDYRLDDGLMDSLVTLSHKTELV
jgi:hypothetical protein